MNIKVLYNKKGVRAIGYTDNEIEVNIVYWLRESYIEHSTRKLVKGKFKFQGVEQDFNNAVEVTDKETLIRLLRVLRDRRDIAIEIALRVLKHYTIKPTMVYGLSQFDMECKIAMLCDEWLSLPDECAYSNCILEQIFSLLFSVHNYVYSPKNDNDEYVITISRKSYHDFKVKAKNIDEATRIATQQAYDMDWSREEAEYNVED